MSHQSITAIWTELEKRTDLATTLREAIGQYAIHVSLGGDDRFAPKSLQAFKYLVNLIKVTFHLQRTYLQSRDPSSKILQFLLEPPQVFDVLHFLLSIKDSCSQVPSSLRPVINQVLRSIAGVLLSGLRLLTLFKTKIFFNKEFDWVSRAELLKSRLQYWPLEEDSLYRFLIRELCIQSLKTFLASTDAQPIESVNALCRYHELHPGPRGFLDLPDYYDDGLVCICYPRC
jgi:hypothetical protein